MRVLLGTTNPSKVKRFKSLLSNHNIDFFTLNDLGVKDEPQETGNDPRENAIIKAEYYGKYFDLVICNDTGLYLEELALYDKRQPGLNVRTPNGCDRLNDDQMIDYYSNLVTELGGRVSAFYLDGVAIYNNGKVYSYIEDIEYAKKRSFYIINKASDIRYPGWPLDSLSLNKKTMKYFVDEDTNEDINENIIVDEYRERFIKFLEKSLGLID